MMDKHFVVYDLTVYGKFYLIICDNGSLDWSKNFTEASLMEQPLAALWVTILEIKEPTSNIGMELA